MTEAQPAAGRRIPLSPGAGTVRRARPDPARQPGLEPEEPGPDGGGARAVPGIARRRAGHPADAARLGAAGGGRPQLRRGRGELLDRPRRSAPDNPSVLLSRAVLLGRMARYDDGAGACSTRMAALRQRRRLGAERMAGERPAARPDGPLRRGLRRLRRGQARWRASVSGNAYLDEHARATGRRG